MFSSHQAQASARTYNDLAQGCAWQPELQQRADSLQHAVAKAAGASATCCRELQNITLRVRITNPAAAQTGWRDKQKRGKTPLNLKNKKVLVVGLARTGLSVARFLKDQGAKVTGTDLKKGDELGSYAEEALKMGVSLKLGEHKMESFTSSDLVVVSPGVPHGIRPLEAARSVGIPVIGEVELASRYIQTPIVAITGTNGKTTTTSLVGEMLKACGREVFVGGNIGAPLIAYLSSGKHVDLIVAEISSFQLDTIEHFRPKVGVLLNITEDHLDRYHNFRHYVRSKGRLFKNQERTDVAVLNGMDPAVSELESSIHSQKLYFNIDGSAGDPEGLTLAEGRPTTPRFVPQTRHGVAIQDKELICTLPGEAPLMLSLDNFRLKGEHNLENAAAASLAALVAGCDPAGVQTALDTFEGLHHRLEHVKNVNGVEYYNDSKATNVDAVKRSLESFDTQVILIMGGRDKGGSYMLLEELIKSRVKRLIAVGEAREKILKALGGLTRSERAKTLNDAVNLAYQGAGPGDIVLLSPGCSSFDMFTDYAERGEAFCKAVRGLKIDN